MKTVVFEIVKEVGCGVVESPILTYWTGLIFRDELEAKAIANNMWLDNTTKGERESNWCGLYYIVKAVELK
jgi:hypothetical protein